MSDRTQAAILVLMIGSCGGAQAPAHVQVRSDFLTDAPPPGAAIHLSYTSTVRRGADHVAGGLVRVRSYDERPLDLEVLCVALPEENGVIRETVAAVLRSAPIHVEPQAETELHDVFFSTEIPAIAGPYQVDCGFRPVGETGLFVFPGIANGAMQSFSVREPNLRLGVARSTVDVYDCETEALPVRGRSICVRPAIIGSELATEMLLPDLDRHTIRCTLGGHVVEQTYDSAALGNDPVLRVDDTADLTPGALEVTCAIDPDGVLAESDEDDNEVRATTTVLADTGGWAASVRLVASDLVADYHPGSGETGSPPRWSVRVPFHLDGHPIRAARAECTSATAGLVASGGFGMGGLPENITQPGDHSVHIDLTGPIGSHELDCTLTPTSPTGLRMEIVGARITVHIEAPARHEPLQ